MARAKKQFWSRLDNAAKVFPSTSEKTDTRVFRFVCELKEDINEKNLQTALDNALLEFPSFTCIMRKGFFWYYLEQSDIVPKVLPEYKPACAPLNPYGEKGLLFEVTHFKKRINLEIYHVLTDGTGAVAFLKKIVCEYLILTHSNLKKEEITDIEISSAYQKSQDGFRKYYKKDKREAEIFVKKVYRYNDDKNEENVLSIIEGMVDAQILKSVSKQFDCSISVFLIAVYILAFHFEMSVNDEKRPVSISVPVNLRKYFPSETAKNFFGMVKVAYAFNNSGENIENIIKSVKESLKIQLEKQKLSIRMNTLSALERNIVARIVPLPIKNFLIWIGRRISDRGCTSVVSNMGKIDMPKNLCIYIDSFHVYASTLGMQLCVCSFQNKMSLDFTSAYLSKEVQRRFFEILKNYGIKADIYAN